MIYAVMNDKQSKSDEPLEQIRSETKARQRGKLKIFFGYAAGVGKTYSMLEASRSKAVADPDVVLGYIEPHNRPETEALLLGMEILPPKEVKYRGVKLKEFDLDAALARKPAVIIVDELAHTNAPGLRHTKRWQDVDELLDAGINVYTTLNVQHLESLNDIIARISGIEVRETIPDTVFDQADSIELVDLPPEELLQRFEEGKVYMPVQAERAMQKFFKLPNLIALRELALRRTADRVNAQGQMARQSTGSTRIWATRERLLVCVGPSPTSARLIRVAQRMATALHAPWIAAYVDNGSLLNDAARQKLTRNLNMAEQLGAETVTLSGDNVAEEIVRYAQSTNVTKIIIGKTGEPRWKELIGKSVISQVLHRSGDIDVYVMRGGKEPTEEKPESSPAYSRKRINYWHFGKAILVTAICTFVAWIIYLLGLSETNRVMIFFLGVAFVATRYGLAAGLVSSIASVLVFDFFFVPPYFNFTVNDTQYVITFGVMLAIAIILSTLSHRIRRQAEMSRQRQQQTETLYHLSQKLAATAGIHQLVSTAQIELSKSLASNVTIFFADQFNRLNTPFGSANKPTSAQREIAVAQWVFEHGQVAGAGTDTLTDADALYVPLKGTRGTVGVLALKSVKQGQSASPDQRQFLAMSANQLALAVERDISAELARKVLVEMETESLRNSLLSSISHDLRTPLAVIAGAGSSLLDLNHPLGTETQHEFLQTIVDESTRLALLVDNITHITRLESGKVTVNKQWYPIEEAIGSALERMKKQLVGRTLNTHLPSDLPMVKLDGILIEQVLVNLIENAAKYSPQGSPIDIFTHVDNQQFAIEIADRGPGLKNEERTQVFDKFYRGSAAATGQRGAGLGLAICRAVIDAHNGHIWEENRPDGGARFIFTIPMEEQPPSIDLDMEKNAVG
jgi:two-component system, OmpR family, sensor histidine kinase KdpD